MKTFAAALLIALTAAACRTTQTAVPATMAPGTSGAPNARAAAELFLSAAHAQDPQALSIIWGTAEGPARDRMSQEELSRREFIMLRCLKHDRATILETAPAPGNGLNLQVRLARGSEARVTTLTAVPARDGRWYVQQVDMQPLRDFCVTR